jgi:hypothetical protein
MLATKLSPEEKRRLERYMHDVKWNLRHKGSLDWITQQKLRIALTLLGAERHGGRMLQDEAKKILWDDQPFKERRLRKLINGRRPTQ